MSLLSKSKSVRKIEAETEAELLRDALRRKELLDKAEVINRTIIREEEILAAHRNDPSIMYQIVRESGRLKQLNQELKEIEKQLLKFSHIDDKLMNKLLSNARRR